MPEWITTVEACKIAGYAPDYLRVLLRAGTIEGEKWMRSWRVNKQSLLAYLERTEKLGQRRGAKPKRGT